MTARRITPEEILALHQPDPLAGINLRDALLRARQTLSLSADEAAAIVGMERSYLSAIESGRRNPARSGAYGRRNLTQRQNLAALIEAARQRRAEEAADDAQA